ncbi:unnamed protein product [Blepharisma stoltei]|uniref:Uncharacterized protein n=1 Tax=Blepharisma stoltei TaxID=1481888 RepID=A0AAU9JKP5_9CILI|nr:unnamed protein product [Blepharisma stoltei]
MNRCESNRPTEDRASQRYGYLSRCWELNSIVNSETTEKFIDIVYTRCALEDKTIILVESASRRDVVILRCYFSKQRATSDFPSIGFAELCQFRMLWKIDRTNTDAFSYVLTELNDFHSHQKFSEDQIQYETKLQRIPAHMQKRAIDYFSNKFFSK